MNELQTTELSLTNLFTTYAGAEPEMTIILENNNHIPVGSIIPSRLYSKARVFISETNNDEKYYLVCPELGISIFFSYWKKMKKN